MGTIRKICLYAIYAGVGLILFSPILVDNRFFFPFITTKVFLFRMIVEALLLAYLVLNWATDEFRPRWTPLTVLLAGFIAVAALSSALGHNFYLSFWGDIERGEGLLLWLHLLAFFVILTGTVKSRLAWAALLDFSLGSSLLLGLFGLGQALKLESLLATSGGRVDSTLGNPAFFATYLLLHISIALFLITLRQSKAARVYYAAVILFYAVLIFTTQTRGAVLGLGVGILTGAILLLLSYRESRNLRRISVALILAVVLGAGLLIGFRQNQFVKNSFLARIANVSLQSRTAQTRLATWQAAWVGVKEKPILGWGLENFNVVFNKNFPPIIYEDEGSQVWFDRAHNVIFDRAVTTGLVGLILFLAFLLYPAYYLVRRRFRDPESRNAAIIAASLTVAYLIQDLFIFETVVIYMSLFFVWAFLSSQYLIPKDLSFKLPPKIAPALALIYLAVLGPLLWQVNIKPLRVNAQAASTLSATRAETVDFFVLTDQFKAVLAAGTYGRQEYRVQIMEWVDGQMAAAGELVPRAWPLLEYFDEQIERHIEEDPDNAQNFLLAMRHYNYTYAALSQTHIERLQKALDLYSRLLTLSPTRPQTPQEGGYSHLYLYREYQAAGDTEKSQTEAAMAEEMFLETIELNPRVVESYVNLLMLYLNTGENQKITDVIALMDERQVKWREQNTLARLSNLAHANDRLALSAFFLEELIKLNPQDVKQVINLAVLYATIGERDKAFATAEIIKSFGGDYVQQAEIFVENVQKGIYEKPQ